MHYIYIYMLTPLFSYYSLLHDSVLKDPSLGNTDTFFEQSQQNTIFT